MCKRIEKEPVRLSKVNEPKPLMVNWQVIGGILIFIAFVALAVLMAIACKSPYNMQWA